MPPRRTAPAPQAVPDERSAPANQQPNRKRDTPIDTTVMFSEPEPVFPSYVKTGSRRPATNPFQSPDFGEATGPAADGAWESGTADSE